MSYEDNLIDTTANIITYSVGYGIFRTYILPILILIILIVIAIYLYSIKNIRNKINFISPLSLPSRIPTS